MNLDEGMVTWSTLIEAQGLYAHLANLFCITDEDLRVRNVLTVVIIILHY